MASTGNATSNNLAANNVDQEGLLEMVETVDNKSQNLSPFETIENDLSNELVGINKDQNNSDDFPKTETANNSSPNAPTEDGSSGELVAINNGQDNQNELLSEPNVIDDQDNKNGLPNSKTANYQPLPANEPPRQEYLREVGDRSEEGPSGSLHRLNNTQYERRGFGTEAWLFDGIDRERFNRGGKGYNNQQNGDGLRQMGASDNESLTAPPRQDGGLVEEEPSGSPKSQPNNTRADNASPSNQPQHQENQPRHQEEYDLFGDGSSESDERHPIPNENGFEDRYWMHDRYEPSNYNGDGFHRGGGGGYYPEQYNSFYSDHNGVQYQNSSRDYYQSSSSHNNYQNGNGRGRFHHNGYPRFASGYQNEQQIQYEQHNHYHQSSSSYDNHQYGNGRSHFQHNGYPRFASGYQNEQFQGYPSFHEAREPIFRDRFGREAQEFSIGFRGHQERISNDYGNGHQGFYGNRNGFRGSRIANDGASTSYGYGDGHQGFYASQDGFRRSGVSNEVGGSRREEKAPRDWMPIRDNVEENIRREGEANKNSKEVDEQHLNWELSGLDPKILANIYEMGFRNMKEIQAAVIPKILDGEDICAQSETSSGKTAAYGLPIVSEVNKMLGVQETSNGRTCFPLALVLVPTSELAKQVHENFRMFAHSTNVRIQLVIGQMDYRESIRRMREGCHIMVGTCGRIVDHMMMGEVSMGNLKFLVLDEADCLLDFGYHRTNHITRILTDLNFRKSTRTRQNLLFSATMGDQVESTIKSFLKPGQIDFVRIETPNCVNQRVQLTFIKTDGVVSKNEELEKLLSVGEKIDGKSRVPKTLVFVESKERADYVAFRQTRKGALIRSLTSDRAQHVRQRILSEFKNGEVDIIVASDVCARGLHIGGLERVINYDVPRTEPVPRAIDDFIHRIGRTGRNQKGEAITFIDTTKEIDCLLCASFVEIMENMWQAKNVPRWMRELDPSKPMEAPEKAHSSDDEYESAPEPEDDQEDHVDDVEEEPLENHDE